MSALDELIQRTGGGPSASRNKASSGYQSPVLQRQARAAENNLQTQQWLKARGKAEGIHAALRGETKMTPYAAQLDRLTQSNIVPGQEIRQKTPQQQLDTATRRLQTLYQHQNDLAARSAAMDPAEYSRQWSETQRQVGQMEALKISAANQRYRQKNEGALAQINADASLSSAYRSAEALQSDLDKITAIADDAITHNGGAEIAAYKAELAQKYGLTQQAIDRYAIGGAADRPAGGGITNLWQLYEQLDAQKQEKMKSLQAHGYDYEQLQGYKKGRRDAGEYAVRSRQWQQYAEEHPRLASLETVLVSPFRGIDYAGAALQALRHGDPEDAENYVPLSQSNMDATNFVSQVRGQVSKKLGEKYDREVFDQNVAQFLYHVGMSIADSALLIATMGKGAGLMMGTSAAADGARDAMERGASSEQAILTGLARGAAELIFEKFSIEQLLKLKNVTSVKQLLQQTMRQMGVEASEEGATEIANILSDAAILGAQSDFSTAVEQYRAQGMSESEAKKQVFMDLIGQVGWAAAGGALSGAVMGGAVNTARFGARQTGYDAAAQQGGENAAQTVRADAPKAYAGKSLSSDSGVYRYDFLTALPDMRVTGLPEVTAVRDAAGKVDTGAVVDAGMKNARAVGTVRDGKVFVRNTYTGKQLRIDRTGIRHGLNGPPNRLLTNARLGAVIGDVVQNAVPVNALHNKAEGVTGTYAMAAYATDSRGREFVAIITVEQRSGNVTDLEAYDVLHAASGRQKKASPADTRSQGVYPSTAGTISIEDFLGVVNATHQSILSDDVLQHLGQSRNPGGYYTGQVKFALKAPAEEAADPRSESGLVWAGSDTSPTRLRRATSPQGEAAQTRGQSENADPAGDDVRYSIFEPDSLQHYMENTAQKMVYDRAKDAPGSGSGRKWPSHSTETPFADDSLTGQSGDVKERFSLKTVNGKPIVWIEKSSLTNRELNNHKAVADFIAQHIGEAYTILESGQRVYIGPDLPGEYTQSKYTSYLRNTDRAGFRAKRKAADSLGELIETATNRRWEQTRHTHNKNAKYGMYRYDSTFAFPVKSADDTVRLVRAYDVELLIRNASDGKKYLYDIVNIKENTTAQSDLTAREARLAANKTATGRGVSNTSITGQGGEVKERFSAQVPAVADPRSESGLVWAGSELIHVDRPGLVQDAPYRAQRYDAKTERMVDTLAKMLGVSVRVVDRIEVRDAAGNVTGTANGKYDDATGTIELARDAEDPVQVVFVHEVIHRLRAEDPAGYRQMAGFVTEQLSGAQYEGALRVRQAQYGTMDRAYLQEELVADAFGRMLYDAGALDRFVQAHRSVWQRILDAIRDLLDAIRRRREGRLTAAQQQEFSELEGKAEQMAQLLEASLARAETQSGAAQTGGGNRYYLNADFGRQFDAWLQRKGNRYPGSGRLLVGTTSDALKSIGVADYKIYWNTGKISKIMQEHPSMTARVIKSVPDVLEHPILVMQSQTVANRITLFGETIDADGKPVLVALELSPQSKSGQVQDFSVIASAYGKNNAQRLIDTSDILYIDPDKNRTDHWLGLLRLQLPSRLTNYGSIQSITLTDRDVNGNLIFGDSGGKTAMELAFERAKAGKSGQRFSQKARAEGELDPEALQKQAGQPPLSQLPLTAPLKGSQGRTEAAVVDPRSESGLVWAGSAFADGDMAQEKTGKNGMDRRLAAAYNERENSASGLPPEQVLVDPQSESGLEWAGSQYAQGPQTGTAPVDGVHKAAYRGNDPPDEPMTDGKSIVNKRIKVNEGRQKKHIPGTNEYENLIASGCTKSPMRGTLDDIQKLLDRKAGTGSMIGNNKERVDFGEVIGQYVDPITGQATDTTMGIIHYGSKGAHIVPARPNP